MERLFQQMPDEYEEWTATLQDMEEANRKRNLMNQNKNSLAELGNRIVDSAPKVLQTIDQVTPNFVTAPIGDTMGITGRDPQPSNNTGSMTGSSIQNSGVMNNEAAANLYTGNTDAALASQYGMNE